MYSTHQKGIYGELAFSLHLIEKGYSVLQPMNPNSSYDLVIDKHGVFLRIQVKYLTSRHGVLRIELERPKRKTVSYRDRDVDAIGVYESTENKCYLIPMTSIQTKSDYWLRTDNPKNNQHKGIHFAKEFEI